MGINDRKAQIQKIRQEDIITAAEKVFFSKGVHNATMDEVAEAAEYSKKTIYAYFTSKEQLYDAIICRAYLILNSLFDEALQKAQPPTGLDKVLVMGQAYFDFMQIYPNYFKAIANYETQEADWKNPDEYKSANYQEGNRGSDLLIGCIREGMNDGSISKDLNPVSTAFVLYAYMIGTSNIITQKIPYIRHTYQIDVSHIKDQLIQLIVKSLKP